MKALTLRQPWASLCVESPPLGCTPGEIRSVGGGVPVFKMIEVRSTPAPLSLIGERIAIHAAQRPPTLDVVEPINDILDGLEFSDRVTGWTVDHRRGPGEWTSSNTWCEPLPLGAIVGTVRLAGCVPIVGPSDEHTSDHLAVSSGADGVHLLLCRYADVEPDGCVLECTPVHDQAPFGSFEPGWFAWLFVDAVKFDEPIPHVGRPGLWAAPPIGDHRE